MILLCPPEKSTQFHYPLDPKKILAEGSMHKDTTYQGSDRQDFYRHGKKKKAKKKKKKENKQTKRRPRLGLPIGNPVKKLVFNDNFNSKPLNSHICCYEYLMIHLTIKCFGIIRYLAINSEEKLTFSQQRLRCPFLVVDESKRTKTNLQACAVCP